jgi:predicted  nucleic acid-binding Zn-ribbon protein
MEALEQRQVKMQEDIHAIRKDVNDLSTKIGRTDGKIGEILDAVVGNRLTKDGGLIQRIIDLEAQNKALMLQIQASEKKCDAQILEIKEKAIKSDLYVKILWACGGVVGSGIFAIILNLVFKK